MPSSVYSYHAENQLAIPNTQHWLLHVHVALENLNEARSILNQYFYDLPYEILDLPNLSSNVRQTLDGTLTGDKDDVRFRTVRIHLPTTFSEADGILMKTRLMHCWHSLQAAHVHLYLQTPVNDKGLVFADSGLPTPFSYASSQKLENEFLHLTENHNPNELDDVLQKIIFTESELKQYCIHYNPIKNLTKTITRMLEHAEVAELKLKQDFMKKVQEGDQHIKNFDEFAVNFGKFYANYRNRLHEIEQSYQTRRSQLHQALEPETEDKRAVCSQFVELFNKYEAEKADLYEGFAIFCDNYFNELEPLSQQSFNDLQVQIKLSELRNTLFEKLSHVHTLYEQAPHIGIFAPELKKEVKGLDYDTARDYYNRQMHIIYERRQIQRLVCLREIYSYVKSLNSFWNLSPDKKCLLHTKEFLLRDLMKTIDAHADSGKSLSAIIEEWKSTVHFRDNKSDRYLQNQEVLARHRYQIFKSKPKTSPTNTQAFVEHLSQKHGRFSI